MVDAQRGFMEERHRVTLKIVHAPARVASRRSPRGRDARGRGTDCARRVSVAGTINSSYPWRASAGAARPAPPPRGNQQRRRARPAAAATTGAPRRPQVRRPRSCHADLGAKERSELVGVAMHVAAEGIRRRDDYGSPRHGPACLFGAEHTAPPLGPCRRSCTSNPGTVLGGLLPIHARRRPCSQTAPLALVLREPAGSPLA